MTELEQQHYNQLPSDYCGAPCKQRLVAVWQRQGTMAVQQHQGSTPTHQASRFNILMRLAYLELAVHRHSLAGMEGAQEARLGLRVVLCRQLL